MGRAGAGVESCEKFGDGDGWEVDQRTGGRKGLSVLEGHLYMK